MRLSEKLKKVGCALVLSGFVLGVSGCAQQTTTPPAAPAAGGSKSTPAGGTATPDDQAGSGEAPGAEGAAPADEKSEAKPE